MNRDLKTQATLLALARTRRIQRALAHASLHRNAPMPTLASSLGYMTMTTRVTDAAGLAPGHRMDVIGISRADGVAYVVEDLGADDAPIVYRLYLRGPRQGYLVPLHAWYEHSEDAAEIRSRLATLAPGLEPVAPTAPEAWMLSTRIVQRRALRMGCAGDLPIRKFALQLQVDPVCAIGPSGRSTVTAFLQPHAQLTAVWSLDASGVTPGDLAIARVTFTGIPSGTGRSKDTVILLTAGGCELT
ncbi:MAG TPA: hypothetical protein VGC42_01120 [Kofleriaceae bacterium]